MNVVLINLEAEALHGPQPLKGGVTPFLIVYYVPFEIVPTKSTASLSFNLH